MTSATALVREAGSEGAVLPCGGRLWGLAVLCAQFRYEPKTAPKNKVSS